MFRGLKSRRYLLCFRRSSREVKGLHCREHKKNQKRKVIIFSAFLRATARDEGMECSCVPYTTASAHGIASHIVQEKGELSRSVIATLPQPLGQAPGPGTAHSIAAVAPH